MTFLPAVITLLANLVALFCLFRICTLVRNIYDFIRGLNERIVILEHSVMKLKTELKERK